MENIITELPLSRLATPCGEAMRIGDVGVDAVRNLLRAGAVRFLIADIGVAMRWFPEVECMDVWKKEVHPHLAESGQRVYLEQFPGKYAYFASRWDDGSSPIIPFIENALTAGQAEFS
jgi:hypothetical protein